MLVLHRSERADHLAGALADVVAEPLADPIAAEVVAVPTRGVERWLTQVLATRTGVCANVDLPFPGTLVGRATAAALGIDPATDPWRPERSVWPLVEVIDAHLDDPLLAPLASHLAAATPEPPRGSPAPAGPRRWAAARHLADLFDHYALHRPSLVAAWAAGGDGGGPDAAWQGHLWRLLRDRLGVPDPAGRLAAAAAALAADPDLVDLPERLSVFGLTRIPPGHLDVLEALAAGRDVHLFALHPSAALWDRVAAAGVPVPPRRADDPTARLPTHPLLRSWGRDARELQLVLATTPMAADDHRAPPEPPATLLGRLQADVRADRAPGAGGRPTLDPGDRSVQVHACHGRGRQVEVLRDALLHLLDAHPDLELRDVIVMCPDIEVFAPLIQASFGAGPAAAADEAVPGAGEAVPGAAGDGLPALRIRLADRSLRQTNPLLSVAARLLELAAGRVTASEVLELAARPPVAARFDLDLDDLATLRSMVAGAGVRWGLDADHRRPWHLGGLGQGTWDAGLERLLLGAALGPGQVFAGAVPHDDLPPQAVELAGRLAELVGRLRAALDALATPQAVARWAAALVEGVELLARPAPDEAWQSDQLRAELAAAAEEGAGSGAELTLDEARAVLAGRLAGRPTRANFRTGDLTVCTLVPMRSVPHRVVALLGLDDGSFPRHPELDGDDLLLADPHVGDRDARSEDRQLLLDAVLAATDHLVITYAGRDERTGRPRPPAVPVAELLDVLDATAATADGRGAGAAAATQHPLQPFDDRAFRPGELGVGGPWAYDRVQLAGARAAAAQRPARPWLGHPLPPLDEPVVTLDDLVRFVGHPVRAFLARRLGLHLGDWSDDLDDELPLHLDGLAKWAVGARLLEARLGGADPSRAGAVERARGELPPGPLGAALLDELGAQVEALVDAAGRLGAAGPADSVDVHVELPGGRAVVGTVGGLRGEVVLDCRFSRLRPRARVGAWVRHLALCAGRPELSPTTATLGRPPGGHGPPQVATLAPLPPEAAAAHLLGVLDLLQRGMCEPLPMACATSAAWAEARHRASDEDARLRAATDAWEDSWIDDGLLPKEQSDAEHVLVHGPGAPLAALLEAPPGDDERGPGWPEGETTRFGALAGRLWAPVLAHERVGTAR